MKKAISCRNWPERWLAQTTSTTVRATAVTGDGSLFRTVGYGEIRVSISDIAQADLVVIVGSNTAESHPVLATRVKRAHSCTVKN